MLKSPFICFWIGAAIGAAAAAAPLAWYGEMQRQEKRAIIDQAVGHKWAFYSSTTRDSLQWRYGGALSEGESAALVSEPGKVQTIRSASK